MDALAARVDTTFDREQLRELYMKMQELVWDDMVYFPIIHPLGLMAKSKRLKIGPMPDTIGYPTAMRFHEWDVVDEEPVAEVSAAAGD